MKKKIRTLIIVLFIFLLLNIVSIFRFSLFGFRAFKVASGSMEPTLRINSVIVVKKTNNLKVGDIITYKDAGGYTTHRIVNIDGEKIVTQGDANQITDEPITKDSVIGKEIIHLNFFGFIMYLLKNPIIWILLLIIGVLVVLVLPIKNSKVKKGNKSGRHMQKK